MSRACSSFHSQTFLPQAGLPQRETGRRPSSGCWIPFSNSTFDEMRHRSVERTWSQVRTSWMPWGFLPARKWGDFCASSRRLEWKERSRTETRHSIWPDPWLQEHPLEYPEGSRRGRRVSKVHVTEVGTDLDSLKARATRLDSVVFPFPTPFPSSCTRQTPRVRPSWPLALPSQG